MGHIVQRLVRNAIMQAVNQVIQKKTQQEAAKFGNEGQFSLPGIRVLQRHDR